MTFSALGLPSEITAALGVLAQKIDFTSTSPKGGNGYVFVGNHKILQRRVVVKFYYWGTDRRYHAEPQQLANLKSPNIIEIYDAAEASGEWAYFITPYYQNGDIDQWIATQGLPSTHGALALVLGLLSGLSTLHSNRLVHRDLKPANIFVSETNTASIGDFGSVRLIPKDKDTARGSAHAILYRPPESLACGEYGFSGDLYQCGIILYQLLGGYLPYDETAWLNKREKAKYDSTVDNYEKGKIADDAIKKLIGKGNLLDMSTIHPTVDKSIIRILNKVTAVDPRKRHQTTSDLHNCILQAKKNSVNWLLLNQVWTTDSIPSFRFLAPKGGVIVEKKKNSDWRRDNGFTGTTEDEAIDYIKNAIGPKT